MQNGLSLLCINLSYVSLGVLVNLVSAGNGGMSTNTNMFVQIALFRVHIPVYRNLAYIEFALRPVNF